MAATKAAAQTGAPKAAMWVVASVTGTQAAARGAVTRVEGCEMVEGPSCTGAGASLSISGYATADESLATGSN